MPVFKTGAINHSATSPAIKIQDFYEWNLRSIAKILQRDYFGSMAHGSIIEASGVFYLRYSTGTTLSAAGKPRPIQKTHRLCSKDDKHHSTKCKAVRHLADTFMLGINQHRDTEGEDMTVAAFWETRFLPYCEEIVVGGRPRRKPSTMRGYKQIWLQHLKAHFGKRMLREYRAAWGSTFLDGLTSTCGRNTLRHVSALASSILSRAVAEQRLRSNPWVDVSFPESATPTNTPHYTWEEAENVISALVDRVDCQLIIALACFLGLRPNEIAALRWEDFDAEWLHVRRGIVHGKLDTPKTDESVRSIPLLPQVRVPLELWRRKSTDTSGWVFPSEGTLTAERIIAPEMQHLAGGVSPVNLTALCKRVIRPAIEKAKLPWKPLKAGRTGACTAIIEGSNGNAALAQAVLGHKSMTTTLNIYKKAISPANLLAGMKALKS
jgi:integrase